MTISIRSQLTAGAAVLSAGAIALTPIQPVDRGTVAAPALASVNASAVQLAAFDVVTPWLQVVNDASLNVANLANSALGPSKSNSGNGQTVGAPLVIAQQWAANQLKFASEFPDLGLILSQLTTNVGAAIAAPFQADLTTLDELHTFAYTVLPQLAPDLPQGLINILTTAGSGVVIGGIGAVLAPVLALSKSITDIFTALKAEDWSGALNEVFSIAPKMTGAFLNGGPVLDLMFLAPILKLPDSVVGFGLKLPGVLSPGGSGFNALDMTVEVPGGLFVPVPGATSGPIGSIVGLGWEVASALGWNRNSNPLKPGIPVPTAASRAVAPSAAALAPVAAATADSTPAALIDTADAATPVLTATAGGGTAVGAPVAAPGHKASRGAGKSAANRQAEKSLDKAAAARRG